MIPNNDTHTYTQTHGHTPKHMPTIEIRQITTAAMSEGIATSWYQRDLASHDSRHATHKFVVGHDVHLGSIYILMLLIFDMSRAAN